MPAVPMGAALAVLLVAQVSSGPSTRGQSANIGSYVEQIRVAERAYAADPDHAYTCNDPDLPNVHGIEWHANTAMGLTEKLDRAGMRIFRPSQMVLRNGECVLAGRSKAAF